MITKDELTALASKHYLTECDIEDAIRFVHDLLTLKATILQETEPYATTTARHLLNAAYAVYDLENDIEEIMEDDEDESED